MKAAEEAQARAENELLEFAAERRKTDEALDSLKQQLEMVSFFLSSFCDCVGGVLTSSLWYVTDARIDHFRNRRGGRGCAAPRSVLSNQGTRFYLHQ